MSIYAFLLVHILTYHLPAWPAYLTTYRRAWYCVASHGMVFHCIALHCIYHFTFRHIALHYTTLHHIKSYYITAHTYCVAR